MAVKNRKAIRNLHTGLWKQYLMVSTARWKGYALSGYLGQERSMGSRAAAGPRIHFAIQYLGVSSVGRTAARLAPTSSSPRHTARAAPVSLLEMPPALGALEGGLIMESRQNVPQALDEGALSCIGGIYSRFERRSREQAGMKSYT